MVLVIQPPFSWVPWWERKRCLFASTLSDECWRLEAALPMYRMHAFRAEAGDLFPLDIYEEDFQTMAGDFLKRAIESATSPAAAVTFRDEWLEKEYPALYDYLACAVGPAGKPREGACLIIYARDGEVTACLKDRGLKRAFYGRSDGLLEALKELESRLKSP